MSIQDCLDQGQKSFANVEKDQFGHAGAWVSAIYFFVAGEASFPEGFRVMQYAMDRKEPWDMNGIVPNNPKETIAIRDTLKRYASLIPGVLFNFKKLLDGQKLPIGNTAIHRQLLTSYFQIEILQQLVLDLSAPEKTDTLAPASNPAKKFDKRRIRDAHHDATVITNYFLGHPIILTKALDLCQKQETSPLSENRHFKKVPV